MDSATTIVPARSPLTLAVVWGISITGQIAAKIGKSIFDSVASGIDVPIAVNIAQQLSDNEFSLTSELMERIEAKQTENDEFNKKKRELELKALEASAAAPQKPAGVKSDEAKKGHSYSDRLEQKKHEKIGENRTKNVRARQEGKKL